MGFSQGWTGKTIYEMHLSGDYTKGSATHLLRSAQSGLFS